MISVLWHAAIVVGAVALGVGIGEIVARRNRRL